MAYVVTERCVNCRYTDCCAVCPVECFWETESPAMLVIDPVTCIDCAQCVPECPIYAIYPEAELPEPYKVWTQKNKELFPKGKQCTVKKDALPSAIPLAEIQAKEKAKGWKINEPSAVASGSAPKKESKPKGAAAAPAAGAAAAATSAGSGTLVDPKEVAAANLKKKMAELGISVGEAPEAGPQGYRPVALHLPKAKPRVALDVFPGGKIRLGFRKGTVKSLRRNQLGAYSDVSVLFDGDGRVTWLLYSSLQTFKEKGEFEVLDPGPRPGFIRKFFGA